MRLSLIVTTYNWKAALRRVLANALAQTRLPDEILVADDGSSDGTELLVREFAGQTALPVIHCWQEDKGFRAARARNLAITAASGDYLVMIDGDMLIESHFIEDHLAAARSGSFVQGGRVLLSPEKTAALLAGEEADLSLFAPGLANRKNRLRCRRLSQALSSKTYGIKGIKTCNFALFKEDALKVNGFDEDYLGWGREDSDFAVRLLNAGISRINLRFAAVAFHLHHPVQSRHDLLDNDLRLAQTIANRRIRCLNGIDQHLEAV